MFFNFIVFVCVRQVIGDPRIHPLTADIRNGDQIHSSTGIPHRQHPWRGRIIRLGDLLIRDDRLAIRAKKCQEKG